MTAPFSDQRPSLVEALAADLVGPYAEDERLPLPPSRWYLTGFLVSKAAREAQAPDPDDDDDLAAGNDENEEETQGSEPEPKQTIRLPASMGLSVLLPAAGAQDEAITATVTCAEYVLEELAQESGRKKRTWRRVALPPVRVEVPLNAKLIAAGIRLTALPGIALKGKLATAEAPRLPAGTRALSLFIVNERPLGEKGRYDEGYLFQVELSLSFAAGFVARPDQRDASTDEWDDRVADLQFRDRAAHAVGHGVSVKAPTPGADGRVTTVTTTWLPTTELPRVVTFEDVTATVAMEELAALPDGAAARAALTPLVTAYGEWLEAQRRLPLMGSRAETRDELVHEAEKARARIAYGIELLATNPQVLDAFRLANRAMAAQARRRSPELYRGEARPRWRLFQLAFVLLSLRSIVEEEHDERNIVELIFFPTGGGKTEAYLGVIAFTLLWRRLRGAQRPDQGLGVAVILRYTLRLLTLDQLGRAATLVCALELVRREQPVRLGDVRFAVGLWVGRSATANTMKEIAEKLTEYKTSTAKNPSSPFPLTHCPWCEQKEKLGPDSFTLKPSRTAPTEVVAACTNPSCDFSPRHCPEGLPVVFVDEQIYRELPAFLIATVDKLAMLPWRGETGMLFGRAVARQGRTFWGPLDAPPVSAEKLPAGLYPPELIVQDELHLISGPLGTMVGLYETAVEALCTRRTRDGDVVRPKILASTATVRRAPHQIAALMGRANTALFPPPGPEESETFFATIDRTGPGRRYVGVAAPGRAMKAISLRVYVALLAATQKLYDAGDRDAVDAYMTLAGYFNSLRELGGMRRLVEDDVRVRCAKAHERRPLGTVAPHRYAAARTLSKEPVELTSRERTALIAQAKARLSRPHTDPEHVDVLLASNMISVGVDIDRLGLMVVAGQPKTTAEYIQASSRVGRQARWPGLVVTCFNVHKPRDRSHYEQFIAYHESFYRFVEVTSLTPFSGPALDRGLAATLVALTRLAEPAMTPPRAAMAIEQHRAAAAAAVAALAGRAGAQPGIDGATHEAVMSALTKRGNNLIDAWISVVKESRAASGKRSYSRFDREKEAGKALLFLPLDEHRPPTGTDEAKFAAPTSMRDVEPTVHLWLERRHLGGKR